MTDKTQPEALRLALSIDLMDTFTDYQQEELNKAAAELRSQHARIAELEAQLASIGAGGVQALSAAPAVGMTIAGDGASALGRLMREQRQSRRGVYPDGNPNAMLAASPTPTPLAEQQAAPKAAPGEPAAIKMVGYGGCTGINDYLMSDGTIKTMRPHEVVWREAPQQEAQEPAPPTTANATYHLGACIVDDVLHATVMRKEPGRTGAVTILLSEKIPVNLLHNGDVIVDTAPHPAPAPLSDVSALIAEARENKIRARAFEADAARWRLVETASSDVTLRLHNLRPDQRAQYIDAALAAQQ